MPSLKYLFPKNEFKSELLPALNAPITGTIKSVSLICFCSVVIHSLRLIDSAFTFFLALVFVVSVLLNNPDSLSSFTLFISMPVFSIESLQSDKKQYILFVLAACFSFFVFLFIQTDEVHLFSLRGAIKSESIPMSMKFCITKSIISIAF